MIVAFQESNIEWLGKIPKHWSITKLKNQCQIIPSNVDKKSHDDETEIRLCNYVDVYYNETIDDSIDYMVATANEHELKKFQLFIGDVVITKDSEDPHDIAVPALVVKTQLKLLCGYHLSIIRSNNRNCNSSYIFWALRDAAIVSQLHREATGITRWAIANKHVKNSILPFPPVAEQKAISIFLDKTCTAIDKAVESKQKQLKTLDNLRNSIIYKAVTRGLDSSVELKDSGVEWLGRIPKHWEFRQIKRDFHITLGKMLQSTSKNNNETEEYYLRSANIKWGKADLSDVRKMWFSPNEKVRLKLEYGDLLVSEGGDVGRASIWKNELSGCYIQNAINRVRPRKKDRTTFLFYWLFFMKHVGYIDAIVSRITIAHLTAEKLEKFYYLHPPVEEQINIVNYLDKKTEEISKIEGVITSQIKTLEQYRKSLIHECVTGKRRITEEDVQGLL